MTIFWPGNLPLGIKYGASTEAGKGSKISSDMDYGNKKRRRRFTNVASLQTVQLKFTDNQFAQFFYFYQTQLLSGVASFYAVVITPLGMEYRRCTIDDDSIEIVHENYNYHTVSFTLEIYNIVGGGFDEGALWLLAEYGPQFVEFEFADPLQLIVNVLYPQAVEPY